MKLNLNSSIIFVQDVNKLRSFYVDILGLEIQEETDSEWLLLKVGNCSIGLHKIGEQYANRQLFKFDNNTKIVFEIDEDIHNFREKLLLKNVAMKAGKTFDKYDFFNL